MLLFVYNENNEAEFVFRAGPEEVFAAAGNEFFVEISVACERRIYSLTVHVAYLAD